VLDLASDGSLPDFSFAFSSVIMIAEMRNETSVRTTIESPSMMSHS
jgi:hypothetical protein